ncbi:MAG: LysM peptidoglycan-binding domain-containing protein, partial [Chloroflexi bacterium]|nr:LysM peptidoglycan-binding domain-containing protein [Chloroflexota bacterium]MYD38060.1 LysM peptidoglycan-binding domain-containing protein [Chloroflexota bacterium]
PSPTISPAPTRQIASPTAPVAIAATSSPTAPPSPSPSPVYFEYEVQAEDTLMGIIQVFGYGYQLEVAQEVVRLNDSVFSIDFVPVGQVIRIPRPTATATPVGAQATAELLETIGIDSATGLEAGAALGCHTVVANDTMVSIAERYNTTLEILSDLNSDLNWSGCNFTLLAGGEDCVPILKLGACIQVPQPTPTSTRFPTPTGLETPTPTATKLAPRLLYPAEGEQVNARQLVLQWLGLSGLREGDVYLVELQNQTTGGEHRQRTSANSYRVPVAFAPRGEVHTLQWRVSLARQNEAGIYAFVGEQGNWRRFEWNGS